MRTRILLTGCLLILVLLLGGCGPGAGAPPTVPTSTPAPTQERLSPEQFVDEFYRGYIRMAGEPLPERWYANSPYLSQAYVGYLDELFRQPGELGYDPILMAQAAPNGFEVELLFAETGAARLVVHEHWINAVVDLTVDLIDSEGRWLIYSIQEGNPATPEGVVRLFYNWYLAYSQDRGSPLADAAYTSSPYLAPAFAARVKAETSGQAAAVDPFVLARDTPDEIYLYAPVVDGAFAQVLAESVWRYEAAPREIRQVQVLLENKDGTWMITNIVDPLSSSVPGPGNGPGSTPAADDLLLEAPEFGFSLPYPDGWVVGDPYARPDSPSIYDETLLCQYLVMPAEVFKAEQERWAMDLPPAATGAEWVIPYRVDVYHTDRATLLEMFPPASFEQETVYNGNAATVRILADGMHTQYVFAHPQRPDTWIIVHDLISGNAAHALQARALTGVLERMLEGIQFYAGP